MANARVYLETSFFRYLIAQPSAEAIKADRQEITRLWWSNRRHGFSLRVSQIVYDEFCTTSPAQIEVEDAQQRAQLLQAAELLPLNRAILDLAKLLLEPHGPLPTKAEADALHWAVAAVHGCEYVLTWNYRHLNNAFIKRRAERIIKSNGYESPTICTPEELY